MLPTPKLVGVATIEAVSTNDRLPVQAARFSEAGFIASVVAQSLIVPAPRGGLFAEVGVMKGGEGDQFKAAILAGGYIYVAHPIWWVGNLWLEPNDRLFLEVRGNDVYTVRAMFMIVREE